MAAVNNVPRLVDKKGAKDDDKPESQWTPDERRVVVQDQLLKSIIMSCLPDDIMESIISCEIAKATWADLALINTPSSNAISTAFFSNNVIQYFQENSDDEVNERSSEEYLRDLDIDVHERALLTNSKLTGYSSVSKGFQPMFTPKLIQSSQNSISQANLKTPNTFQPKNKGLVAETFDWDEEEVADDEEVTRVKVLIALADDEITVGKNHASNGE
ncbi:hypothetical protein Tco_0282134 [Tanacetum coccineum]